MQITLINTFDSAKVCIRILSSSNFEFNESMFRLRTVIFLEFLARKFLNQREFYAVIDDNNNVCGSLHT